MPGLQAVQAYVAMSLIFAEKIKVLSQITSAKKI